MHSRLIQASMLFLAPSALVLACSGTVTTGGHDPPSETGSPAQPITTSPPATAPPATAPLPPPVVASCVAADAACGGGGDPCCEGLYCADTGYGQGLCRPPEPSGAFCQDDSACQSGICHQYSCVDALPACVGIGAYCADGAPCCEGYCLPLTYAPDSGTCAPLQEAGSSCSDGSECQSGICDLYLCRAADCSAAGSECEGDASCCGGFCTAGAFSYAPGACTAPQAAGAYCESWRWCASMSCVDGVCGP